MPTLHWLRLVPPNWRERLRALPAEPDLAWAEAMGLANARLDFVLTNALDEIVRRQFTRSPPNDATKPVRLAILGSATLTHLHAAIRVAGLRRGIWIDTYEGEFGQYLQELSEPGPLLRAFQPTHVLLALDAHHLASGTTAALDGSAADAALVEVTGRIREAWRLAGDAFGCPILYQTALPVHFPVLGANEHRLPGSRARLLARLNQTLRDAADEDGVDLLALDARAAQDGLDAWYNPVLWHRAKLEIAPPAAPMYGELVARLIAAGQGRTHKCLVLDLDNTLWGGVIGDDGLEGIVLGQGSTLGEAYAAFQTYCRELASRGVILAVSSKNDETNALEPFDRHPDMVLKRSEIACFMANWSDKAANLRAIAAELNIGLDALVFVDDNPFERELIRSELPMVAVPEVGDDPTFFSKTIADGGYFEALAVTAEDRERTGQYQGNRAREGLRASVTDLASYLRGLEMQLIWRRFDRIGLQRTVQLINKSNQFNLTTRRYTEAEVLAVMEAGDAVGLQLRLLDRFGDNGMIAVVIIRGQKDRDVLIDTWLMSCRVLGRQVEAATLGVIAEEARRMGARRLVGEYIPTAKNAMVKDHYAKLGFTTIDTTESGDSRAVLELARFQPTETFIHVAEG